MPSSPRVSVIIATYNWSSVLRYSIGSVLWQTFQDFEILVIGDACTDDSAEVVASFHDARIRWHNLAVNSGSQSAPNNAGLEMARGEYIAYLGHDDLWHPDHIQTLLESVEHADAAYAITEFIYLAEDEHKDHLEGFSPDGTYERLSLIAPSSLLHRRNLVEKSGGWRDYRAIILAPDMDFILRLQLTGARFVPTNELTVFKFPSANRKNSYLTRSSIEQAAYAARIQHEPDFRYRELRRLLRNTEYITVHVTKTAIPEQSSYGTVVAGYRAERGLAVQGTESAVPVPVYADPALLSTLNMYEDITFSPDLRQLYTDQVMPPDSVFLGLNWHALENTEAGLRYRWFPNDAQIVIARPTGTQHTFQITLASGPGIDYEPVEVELRTVEGQIVTRFSVEQAANTFTAELPIIPGDGQIFTLHIEANGHPLPDDSRVMNIWVSRLGWANAKR